MSNLLAAIRARNAPISHVNTQVKGRIEDAPARFAAVKLWVTADGGGDELQHLVQIADRGCIMMNTLRDKLDVSIEIGASESLIER